MTARTRLLVIGGDGLIGGFLAARLSAQGWDTFSTTRRPVPPADGIVPLDLADPGAHEMALPRVDVAVFCAAMARFADCRAAPDLARRVNVEAPLALARRLASQGSRVILLSTAAVFDGTRPYPSSDLPVSPASLYGALKAEAERGFATLDGRAAVIRLTKVLDPAYALFCGWRAALRRGEPVDAFEDLRFAPIGLDDVLAGVRAAVDGASMVQVSAAIDISYFEAAAHLAASLAVEPALVRRASAAARGVPESDRPLHATLDASTLAASTYWTPPDPRALIDKLFADR